MKEEPPQATPPYYPGTSLPPEVQPPAKKFPWVYLLFIVLAVLLCLSAYAAYRYKLKAGKSTAAIAQQSASKSKTSSSSSPSTAPKANINLAAINLTSMGFVPATISIKTGQAIVWTNTDSRPHQLSVGSSPDSNLKVNQTLSPSDSYSYVFSVAGNYVFSDCYSQEVCASNQVQVN